MIALPESIIGSTVDDLRKDIMSYLDKTSREEDVIFDFSNTQDIDTAGLQVLLSVFKTLENDNRLFYLKNVSPFVQHIFALAGLSYIIDNNKAEKEV